MKNPKSVFAIFLPLFAIFVFACQVQRTEWKGTITTENGVTVVQNPKEPMYGEEALVLEEDLSIGESAAAGDYLFSSIRAITSDDVGNIYVLDMKENHILAFDSAGQYLRTFGRAGQGPGEFTTALTMGLVNGNMIVIEDYRNRLVYFSTEGEYIRNLPTAKTGVRRIYLDSRSNILGIVTLRDGENSRYELSKYDPDLNILHTLGSAPTPSASTEGFNPFSGSIYYRFDKDERVVWGVPDHYEIRICDTTGRLAQIISREYDPVEITEEEKKEAAEGMPQGIKVVIPKYHNAFQWFTTDDEGRIFVMTWERIPENDGYFYDVFDGQGRYLAKIPLKFRPFLIKNKKFYTVREDEEGFHVVKRYNVIWRIAE